MLSRTTAVRFDRRISSGKTWPCLLSCVRVGDEDVQIEVVAKFSAGCERKVGGLVAEAIVAMLAADLDLPVPEPVLVDFDAELIEIIRAHDSALAERIGPSAPVAFGSTKLPAGFTLLPQDKAIPQALRAQAADIFGFDALIQNPDRRTVNPNCLLDGRSFAIFDHELAFMTRGIVGWQPPWQIGSLEMLKGPVRHVFFLDLQGKAADFNRLKGAWQAITDGRLREYGNSLPPEWTDDGGVAGEALGYIAQVRDNIDSALAEVTRC